jgi:uncharacterized protein (TIGR02391 family)
VEIIEEKVFTTLEEVDQAIVKLTRRLEEVEALDPHRIRYDDPSKTSAAQNFSAAVLAIYGVNSPEYRRYRYHRIQHGSEYIGMGDRERQENFAEGIKHTAEAIKNLIRGLEERKADFGADTTSRVRSAFEGLDLHPRIASVCVDLYRNGHYRNAVLDAAVALVNYVREKSRRPDLDGAPLMTTVFSKNAPILAFNDLRDQTEQDEQQGMMHLFVGAVLGLRNPRAHALNLDTAEGALEYIAFLSMLAKRVDQAKRTTP